MTIEMHEERTDLPNWDTAVYCTCGFESRSRAEQWKHAADAYHAYDAMGCVNMLLPALKEATALAEERLAGLGRLRAECEAWQKASAGWQARCSELEGLLGEALKP